MQMHNTQLYLDFASDLVVNEGTNEVVWSDVSAAKHTTLHSAHVLTMQPSKTIPFNVRGDEIKANWVS